MRFFLYINERGTGKAATGVTYPERRLFELGLVGRREHLRPLVALALNTGVRRGGLLSLEREHVNLSDRSTFVEVAVRGGAVKKMEVRPKHMLVVRNKRGGPYSLPLNPAARATIAELLANEKAARHLFVSFRTGRAYVDTKKGLAAACLAAGIDGFTFHDCVTRSPRDSRRRAWTRSPSATCWGTPAP